VRLSLQGVLGREVLQEHRRPRAPRDAVVPETTTSRRCGGTTCLMQRVSCTRQGRRRRAHHATGTCRPRRVPCFRPLRVPAERRTAFKGGWRLELRRELPKLHSQEASYADPKNLRDGGSLLRRICFPSALAQSHPLPRTHVPPLRLDTSRRAQETEDLVKGSAPSSPSTVTRAHYLGSERDPRLWPQASIRQG